MAASITRIAVCQLEAHPALRNADRNFLGEPFCPDPSQPSLTDLSRYAIDVADARRACEKRYIEWSGNRIRLVLEWLSRLSPPPHIVVFAEGGIPPTELHFARDFAQAHDAVVFAGTHTFSLTKAAEKLYRSLGIRRSDLKRLEDQDGKLLNVLPIFSSRTSEFHLKTRPAVFELTDVVPAPVGTTPTIQCVDLQVRGMRLTILPLVCAEALQLHNTAGRPDLAVICAYNKSIEPFAPFIAQNTRNKIPVVFCNDGRFGQSAVLAQVDSRVETWWWAPPNEGRLPVGDGLLVVDVDLAARAPEVGVANPSSTLHLKSIAAVVGEHGLASPVRIADVLPEIASRHDQVVQAQLLRELLQQEAPTAIQRLKLQYLNTLVENDAATQDWWLTLKADCLLPQLPDLRILEGELAGACLSVLDETLQSGVIREDAAVGRLHKLAQRCRAAAATSIGRELSQTLHQQPAPLDRVDEAAHLRSLLDNKTVKLVVVSGLQGVGKRTLVDLALRQAGRAAERVLELASDATPEFLIAALFRIVGLPLPERYDYDLLDTSRFRERLQWGLILCVHNAEHLTSHGSWRDSNCPGLLLSLARGLSATGGKLILQSPRQLTIEGAAAGEVGRLPLRGLDPENAVALLDQQLRRVGLEPTGFNSDDRRSVVTVLGGHPGAIILASEFIASEGMRAVVTDLRDRKGIHASIVRLVMTKCEFTEEERLMLSVLNGIRVPIPAKLLDAVFDFPAVPVAMELWRASVVDRVKDDDIVISSLLRGFADIPPCRPNIFAKANDILCEYFAQSSLNGQGVENLRWATESRYHAALAGRFSFAPSIGPLADGVLGALIEKVRAHDYQGAKPLVDGLLQSHRTAEVCQEAAIVYARLGDAESALTLAKEAWAKDPHRVWVLTQVGNIALYLHRNEIAEDAVRIVKATGHDSPYLAVLEGRICMQREDRSGAIAAFRRGVAIAEVERRDAWPFLHLGRELIKNGEIDEAIDVLYRGETLEAERARRKRNALVAIRTQLAIAHIMAKDLTNAQRYLRLVLDEDAGNPEVARANVLFKAVAGAEDVATAIAEELDPNRARHRFERSQIHLYRGLFFLNTGNREKASEEFSLAHRADPQNVFVLLRWCETLIEIAGDLSADRQHEASRLCAEQAKSTADKVLEFDRDNSRARDLLEKIADQFSVL